MSHKERISRTEASDVLTPSERRLLVKHNHQLRMALMEQAAKLTVIVEQSVRTIENIDRELSGEERNDV